MKNYANEQKIQLTNVKDSNSRKDQCEIIKNNLEKLGLLYDKKYIYLKQSQKYVFKYKK